MYFRKQHQSQNTKTSQSNFNLQKKLLASDNLRPDLTKEKVITVAKNQEKEQKAIVEGYKFYESKLNKLLDIQEIIQELDYFGLVEKYRPYFVDGIDREEKLTDKIDKYEENNEDKRNQERTNEPNNCR